MDVQPAAALEPSQPVEQSLGQELRSSLLLFLLAVLVTAGVVGGVDLLTRVTS